LLDEFARLGRASVIASGFSYVAGYGIRLMPVIQSRSQLRGVYGRDVTDEIVANCGAEIIFTPKELQVAKEVSERLGNKTVKSTSHSRKTLGGIADGSSSTSAQRRALMLPQELMLLPADDLIVLRSGILPVKGKRIRYFEDKSLLEKTSATPPVIAARSVDREALAALRADLSDEAEIVSEISDDEIVNGIDPATVILNPVVVEGLKDNVEDGVKQLDMLFSTAPSEFVK
jgi:type IV secretion system protein VirD4